jgi:hypothetical protein
VFRGSTPRAVLLRNVGDVSVLWRLPVERACPQQVLEACDERDVDLPLRTRRRRFACAGSTNACFSNAERNDDMTWFLSSISSISNFIVRMKRDTFASWSWARPRIGLIRLIQRLIRRSKTVGSIA